MANVGFGNSLERDVKKIFSITAKCGPPFLSYVMKDTDLLVLLMGPQFIPDGINPTNSKQRRLKKLLDSHEMLIADGHKKKIVELYDISSKKICDRNPPKLSNTFLRDLMQKSISERAELIKQLKRNNATYKDFALLASAENKMFEEILVYWSQKDADASGKFERIVEKASAGFGDDLMRNLKKIMSVFAREFDYK